MVPYDGTPIKDELERTGRLRGDVCNPDYDFLDPRLEDFHNGLTSVLNVDGWIHGLKAVTTQLQWAWNEVAVMERLFPALRGMPKYKKKLAGITKASNALLLEIVEDLSYVYSDNKPIRWDPEEIEQRRKGYLDDLLRVRDAFVFSHQDILLHALERDSTPIEIAEPARLAATA
jgi:hypothetical protein